MLHSSALGRWFEFPDGKDGNRLTQTLGSTTTTYGYGAGSDLLQTMSVGGSVTQTVGYTADGRMASFSPGLQSPSGQVTTALSYNQDAQLSAVNDGTQVVASYIYNGFGQRVLKAFPGGTGEIYQYGQNGMLLEETDQAGTPQADYIYLNGRPIATLNPATGTLYYLQDDRLGTPQLATDSSQTVAWQAAYGPFGQASVSGSITQNLRFPGQYYDVETGWNHNGFRDYIPELGRYAEPDPLGRLGSGNDLYGYVGDNPENFVDPLGLQKSCGCGTKHKNMEIAQEEMPETPEEIEAKREQYERERGLQPITNPAKMGMVYDAMNPGPLPEDIAKTFREPLKNSEL